MYSEETSSKLAPILLIFTYPLIPKVEGNRKDTISQKRGIEAPGQEIPEIKSKGMDVKTKITILVSLLRTKIDNVIAKKIHANK